MNKSKEFRALLGIANGSSNELNTQLMLAVRIGYVKENDLMNIYSLLTQIKKMNFTLIKKILNL